MRELRWVFGQSPEAYERYRPVYPPDLFDAVLEYAGVKAGRRALEIGAGTGQATLPFLQAGCRVDALEPAPGLACILAEKNKRFSGFNLLPFTFEEISESGSLYDLIFSASAFHWLPKQEAYAKCLRLLKPDGTLALFWNATYPSDPRGQLFQEILSAYRRWAPEIKLKAQEDPVRYMRKRNALLRYGFAQAVNHVFRREKELSTESYLGWLGTSSHHLSLSEPVRSCLETQLRYILSRHGKSIKVIDVTDLYLGRKD